MLVTIGTWRVKVSKVSEEPHDNMATGCFSHKFDINTHIKY